MSPQESQERLARLRCAVVLPTYNNARTLRDVITQTLEWSRDIIVVNDGSTDNTSEILADMDGITVIEYPDRKNKGKGHALMTGLRQAAKMGFAHAITMDTDGQHFASDIPTFIDEAETHPGSLLVGARNLSADGMPGKNTFANKFSNFWFTVETLQKLSDTQSGFRLYPLGPMDGMKFYTPRYEFEVEVLVRMAWRGVRVANVPIRVLYPEDRVSHFRPGPDFLRISVLNTVLFCIALLWFYPLTLIRNIRSGKATKFLKENVIEAEETAVTIAMSIGVGIGCAILPIWGFQMLTAIGTAHICKLNKIVAAAFANISIPPLIPLIVYASLKVGAALTGHDASVSLETASLENARDSMLTYIAGATALAAMAATVATLMAYPLIRLFRR